MNKEKLRNKVVRVRNEVASRAVQEAFFRAGVTWLEGQDIYLSNPTRDYGAEACIVYRESEFRGGVYGLGETNRAEAKEHGLEFISFEELFKLIAQKEKDYLEVIHVPTKELSELVQRRLVKEGVLWGNNQVKPLHFASDLYGEEACLCVRKEAPSRLGYDKKKYFEKQGAKVLTVEKFFAKRIEGQG